MTGSGRTAAALAATRKPLLLALFAGAVAMPAWLSPAQAQQRTPGPLFSPFFTEPGRPGCPTPEVRARIARLNVLIGRWEGSVGRAEARLEAAQQEEEQARTAWHAAEAVYDRTPTRAAAQRQNETGRRWETAFNA